MGRKKQDATSYDSDEDVSDGSDTVTKVAKMKKGKKELESGDLSKDLDTLKLDDAKGKKSKEINEDEFLDEIEADYPDKNERKGKKNKKQEDTKGNKDKEKSKKGKKEDDDIDLDELAKVREIESVGTNKKGKRNKKNNDDDDIEKESTNKKGKKNKKDIDIDEDLDELAREIENVGTNKKEKRNKKHIEEEDFEDVKEPNKKKKDRKNKNDLEVDEDLDVLAKEIEGTGNKKTKKGKKQIDEEDEEEVKESKKKKDRKSKKEFDIDDDLEELAREIEGTGTDKKGKKSKKDDNDSDVEEIKESKKKKDRKNKKDIDIDDDLDELAREIEGVGSNNKDKKSKKDISEDFDEPKESNKKKKDKKNKKDFDNDEDLDELAREIEGTGNKKSKKGKKLDDDDDIEEVKESNKKSRKNKKDLDNDEDLDELAREIEGTGSNKKDKEEMDKLKNKKGKKSKKFDDEDDIKFEENFNKKGKKGKRDESLEKDLEELEEYENKKDKKTKKVEPKNQKPEKPRKQIFDDIFNTKNDDYDVSKSKKNKKKLTSEEHTQDDLLAEIDADYKPSKESKKKMTKEQKQDEEKLRQQEEARLEEERRKQKEREERKRNSTTKKDENKPLTAKQKIEQQKREQFLQHIKEQQKAFQPTGVTKKKIKTEDVESAEIKKTKDDQKEKERQDQKEKEKETKKKEEEAKKKDEEAKKKPEEVDDGVLDAWDQISDSDEETTKAAPKSKKNTAKSEVSKKSKTVEVEKPAKVEKSEPAREEDHQQQFDNERDRAVERMTKIRVANDQKESLDVLRSPVVCVLGHVDHGKTKILDKLRHTNVQEGEVGGITQQIGATNVPFDAIKSQTRCVKDFDPEDVSIPGLLIIDTPGHESFSNLRSRGSSLCDIAVLVVDIMQGLEPQTLESINLLKSRKTPFLVAVNKIDRVFEFKSYANTDIRDVIENQSDFTSNDFHKKLDEIIYAFNTEGLNASLFWENPNERQYVSLVPTSAISGDGMGNLMSLLVTLCQKRLASRLMFSENLKCNVLEVKTVQGYGTTIDVILINGKLREGDTIVLAGTDGPIVTQIRSLLIPKPMREIRVKGQYDELKEVSAALGVKLAAKDLEKAIAGLSLRVASHEDEVEVLKEVVEKEYKAAMRSIKVKEYGVYVQASTLGALEALLEFFRTQNVPYSGIRIGPVAKRDVMRAAAMLEHHPMYAVILAFDVKIDRDAQDLADKEGVKIFMEQTIYHLGDRYVEYLKEYKRQKQEQFKHVAVFPCRLKILPDSIFNSRDPIVMGVSVDSGLLRTGTPLCVPSREFVEIGIVTSLEFDHKTVDIAKRGVNVCIKIEPSPGHTPKLYGRHFDSTDVLVSKISRESIDACKEHFRDDLGKTEWKVMAELKKEFKIL